MWWWWFENQYCCDIPPQKKRGNIYIPFRENFNHHKLVTILLSGIEGCCIKTDTIEFLLYFTVHLLPKVNCLRYDTSTVKNPLWTLYCVIYDNELNLQYKKL